MDSTTTACIAFAMLSIVLFCVVLMKRPLDEQLQAMASRTSREPQTPISSGNRF